MKKLGLYKFKILEFAWKKNTWYYVILDNNKKVIKKSENLFQCKKIARFSAIEDLALMEKEKIEEHCVNAA